MVLALVFICHCGASQILISEYKLGYFLDEVAVPLSGKYCLMAEVPFVIPIEIMLQNVEIMAQRHWIPEGVNIMVWFSTDPQ